mmetsp:Transcript_28151/g.82413  ORF Transcript_28151/g.82413 Transcript_28151/m.82413 type:complete len:255 (-) Transcript_28151:44-808(-)
MRAKVRVSTEQKIPIILFLFGLRQTEHADGRDEQVQENSAADGVAAHEAPALLAPQPHGAEVPEALVVRDEAVEQHHAELERRVEAVGKDPAPHARHPGGFDRPEKKEAERKDHSGYNSRAHGEAEAPRVLVQGEGQTRQSHPDRNYSTGDRPAVGAPRDSVEKVGDERGSDENVHHCGAEPKQKLGGPSHEEPDAAECQLCDLLVRVLAKVFRDDHHRRQGVIVERAKDQEQGHRDRQTERMHGERNDDEGCR